MTKEMTLQDRLIKGGYTYTFTVVINGKRIDEININIYGDSTHAEEAALEEAGNRDYDTMNPNFIMRLQKKGDKRYVVKKDNNSGSFYTQDSSLGYSTELTTERLATIEAKRLNREDR